MVVKTVAGRFLIPTKAPILRLSRIRPSQTEVKYQVVLAQYAAHEGQYRLNAV